MLKTIERILFTAAFGHGRMIETYLSLVCGLYGFILLVIPEAALQSQATRGDFFTQHGQLMAAPFLIKFYLSGYGVLGNLNGWKHFQLHRIIGAGFGIWLFGWYSMKFALIGAIATVGFPFATIAVFMCLRIMVLASIGLPSPRAPGQM